MNNEREWDLKYIENAFRGKQWTLLDPFFEKKVNKSLDWAFVTISKNEENYKQYLQKHNISLTAPLTTTTIGFKSRSISST